MQTKNKLIWDLPLRLFHWLLVVSIFASWYTSEQEGEMVSLHMQLGYFILGLIIFRIIWGFCGTKHSRFSQFFPTPNKLLNYIKAIKRGETPYFAGHNPLGSLVVFLMLLLILLQASSGLFINDDIFSSGPYHGVWGEAFDQLMKTVHHNVFDLLLILILIHISAIVFYRLKKKTDLISPMITGKKPLEKLSSDDVISKSKIITAILIAVAVGAFVYWLVVINAPVDEYYLY